MPDLKEMRRWARGGKAEGLPKRDFREPPPVPIPTVEVAPGLTKSPNEPETYSKGALVFARCAVCKCTWRVRGGVVRPCRKCLKKYETAIATAVKKKKSGHYTISKDGDDALLHFGRHRGKLVSEVRRTDFSYLNFIINERDEDDKTKYAFPDDLRDIANQQRKLGIAASKSIKIFEDD